mmetsp:Transcript_33033/g.37907  ORF Transcript_33033/g.37907 Transcript_33033/m.37907 type:complete len:119 (-) Transcript_33033:877-1233(-)
MTAEEEMTKFKLKGWIHELELPVDCQKMLYFIKKYTSHQFEFEYVPLPDNPVVLSECQQRVKRIIDKIIAVLKYIPDKIRSIKCLKQTSNMPNFFDLHQTEISINFSLINLVCLFVFV